MSPSSLGFMVHSSPCPPPPTPYKDPFFCKTYPEVSNFILQTDCYAQWKSHSITQLVSVAHCYQIQRDLPSETPCTSHRVFTCISLHLHALYRPAETPLQDTCIHKHTDRVATFLIRETFLRTSCACTHTHIYQEKNCILRGHKSTTIAM